MSERPRNQKELFDFLDAGSRDMTGLLEFLSEATHRPKHEVEAQRTNHAVGHIEHRLDYVKRLIKGLQEDREKISANTEGDNSKAQKHHDDTLQDLHMQSKQLIEDAQKLEKAVAAISVSSWSLNSTRS